MNERVLLSADQRHDSPILACHSTLHNRLNSQTADLEHCADSNVVVETSYAIVRNVSRSGLRSI